MSLNHIVNFWNSKSQLNKQELQVKSQKGCPSSHTTNNLLEIVPTSAGRILQLCKVSSVLVHPFRRSCTYKKYGQTYGHCILWAIFCILWAI